MPQSNLRLVEKDSVDKQKALDAALGQIERAFGKGSVMKLGAQDRQVEIETVPTGSLGLDIGLGIGGDDIVDRFDGRRVDSARSFERRRVDASRPVRLLHVAAGQ